MRWRARTIVQRHGARQASRPQLKRDPLGGHEHELIVGRHSLGHRPSGVHMKVRSFALALTMLAACSNNTGPVVYTILVQRLVSPIYGPDLWRATDSATPSSWSAPAQGWDTASGGQPWCVRVPTTERVVTVVDSQPGGSLGLPQGWVGYVHLSPSAPSWIAHDSIGKVAFVPGPPC